MVVSSKPLNLEELLRDGVLHDFVDGPGKEVVQTYR